MRKTCLLLAALLLLLGTTSAFAETPDLSQMTFEELIELQTLINAEIFTRPEAEDFVLGVGEYLVGRDLQPGTYYAIYESGNAAATGCIHVYADEAKEKQLATIYTQYDTYDVYRLSNLETGNVVVVSTLAIRMNMVGFPDYHAPDGTSVPPGVYEVGVDIPAGRYTAHLGVGQVRLLVYSSQEGYKENSWSSIVCDRYLSGQNRIGVIQLQDGYVIRVDHNSVILNKYTPPFTFD